VCIDFGLPVSHPPPGKPNASPEIERKIGVVINGLRAYLAQAGAPNCFWPFAAHCSAVNKNATEHNGWDKSAYERATGFKWNHKDKGRTFIFGMLVMCRLAPTIISESVPQAVKIDSTLRPGVFLDYYMNWRGEVTGQYLVCLAEQ
jgi:hypothetical protein